MDYQQTHPNSGNAQFGIYCFEILKTGLLAIRWNYRGTQQTLRGYFLYGNVAKKVYHPSKLILKSEILAYSDHVCYFILQCEDVDGPVALIGEEIENNARYISQIQRKQGQKRDNNNISLPGKLSKYLIFLFYRALFIYFIVICFVFVYISQIHVCSTWW